MTRPIPLERCPGAYLWLDVGEDHAPLHSSRFDFDDSVIVDGARVMAALALAVLNDGLSMQSKEN